MSGTRWWPEGRTPDGEGADGDAEADAKGASAAEGAPDAEGVPEADAETPPPAGDAGEWWRVVPTGAAPGGDSGPATGMEPGGPPAAADAAWAAAAQGRGRRRPGRRYPGAARTVAIGLMGALVGAAAMTLAVPAYRVAAQGYPVITTVPVSAQQQAAGAPGVAVYNALSPSVVLVTNQAAVASYYGTQSQTDWGSGVVLTPTGYIVTNDHVVQNSQQVTVTLKDGSTYPAKVIGADAATDLAVIKINPHSALQAATFADSKDIVPGQLAIAIGNPLGPQFSESVTEGIVSAIRPMLYGGDNATTPRVTEMIQTDAPINPGNSGGALANAQGMVIGITSMKVGSTGESNLPASGLGFAIPSNTVEHIVNDLIKLGYVPRAWLGVALNPTPANALPSQPQTLTVASVDAGSPAAKAGLQPGDVVTTWNGKAITNYWQLVGDINAAAPGDTVTLGIRRSGKTMQVTITLGTLPRSLEQSGASATTSGSGSSGSGTSPYQTPGGTPFPYPFPLPPGFGGNG